MRSKCVLDKTNKNTNSNPKTQTHKFKKKPRTQFQIQERKKKTPTYTHFLSFAQTHSKKQHPDLKCNNTNNASLSLCLSLLSKMSSQQWQQKPRTQIQSKSHKAKHMISLHINPPSNGAEAKNPGDHIVRRSKG